MDIYTQTKLYYLGLKLRAFLFGLDSALVCWGIVKGLKSRFESDVRVLAEMQLGHN